MQPFFSNTYKLNSYMQLGGKHVILSNCCNNLFSGLSCVKM